VSKCENEHLFALWAPKVQNEQFFAFWAPKVKKVHFGALWVHLGPFGPPLAPLPPRGGLGCGRLAGGGWGGGGARVGWAASGARSGERRPPLSGSGASAPEVVPLHSYPRRGLIGIDG